MAAELRPEAWKLKHEAAELKPKAFGAKAPGRRPQAATTTVVGDVALARAGSVFDDSPTLPTAS